MSCQVQISFAIKQTVELPRKLNIKTPYPLRKGTLLEKIVALLGNG